jgi:hypothetical protein
MPSTSETGHAKTVANFEDLISFCTGYGAAYNPSKAALKTAAMTTLLASANTSLQAVKTAKTAYDNATNAREVAFLPLRPLATRIINALDATDALRQTIDDARLVNRKIQGSRSKAIKEPEPPQPAGEGGTEPQPKTVSVSQQSFDLLIDHFSRLIQVLAAEPKYTPNENELKVATLNTLLTDLKAKNTAVIAATTALSNARIARDKVLYADITGLCDVALDAKQYIKSLFGTTSPQFKQVSALQFKKRPGK